jgi:transcription elongation factor Elf1
MSFKIKYRGDGSMRHSYEYKCPHCGETHIAQHTMKDSETHVEMCEQCDFRMVRVINAPAFDADWHEGQRAHNLNWDL